MTRSVEEGRAYSRGYEAGRKRLAREYSSELASAEREEFRRHVFLAALPELIRAPWETGGVPWTDMQQFVDGAWGLADKACPGTVFTGRILASAGDATGTGEGESATPKGDANA
jgi:hypothetical protein